MARERRNLFSIVAHMMLYCSVLLSVSIGLTDETSQHYMNGLNFESFNGQASVFWLAAMATLGAVDIIAYDLLGLRTWAILNLRRYRFAGLMILVWGLMALIFQNARWGSIEPVAWRYALDASGALLLTGLDLWTRKRQ